MVADRTPPADAGRRLADVNPRAGPHGPTREATRSLQRAGLCSTGEPWNPDPWLWLFEVVGQRQRPIINYSGGTEIGGGILMGNPILPLKPAAVGCLPRHGGRCGRCQRQSGAE
ncbi:MAG: hypothetical protein R3C44_10605 [Chloroflexota bacterium]